MQLVMWTPEAIWLYRSVWATWFPTATDRWQPGLIIPAVLTLFWAGWGCFSQVKFERRCCGWLGFWGCDGGKWSRRWPSRYQSCFALLRRRQARGLRRAGSSSLAGRSSGNASLFGCGHNFRKLQTGTPKNLACLLRRLPSLYNQLIW